MTAIHNNLIWCTFMLHNIANYGALCEHWTKRLIILNTHSKLCLYHTQLNQCIKRVCVCRVLSGRTHNYESKMMFCLMRWSIVSRIWKRDSRKAHCNRTKTLIVVSISLACPQSVWAWTKQIRVNQAQMRNCIRNSFPPFGFRYKLAARALMSSFSLCHVLVQNVNTSILFSILRNVQRLQNNTKLTLKCMFYEH